MNRFSFLRVLFSPFKLFGLKFYFGKVAIGVPYFYPRRWVESEKPGYTKPVPKKIGFDIVGLGYKTKWWMMIIDLSGILFGRLCFLTFK